MRENQVLKGKKELTVVWPVCVEKINDKTKFWIMMGKQAPGKRLAGIRNGYGGKCEDGELSIDCAVREVKEEINLSLDKDKLICIGLLIEGEPSEIQKYVYFYIYFLTEKIKIADNNEFVDNKWLEVKKFPEYVHEMFAGNFELMTEVDKVLDNLNNFTPFELDLSDNLQLREQAKKIYD